MLRAMNRLCRNVPTVFLAWAMLIVQAVGAVPGGPDSGETFEFPAQYSPMSGPGRYPCGTDCTEGFCCTERARCCPNVKLSKSAVQPGRLPLFSVAASGACELSGTLGDAAWTTMPGIAPGETGIADGVSAMYAGSVEGVLVVAGGANFPGVPAAEGGPKAFYDGIYVFRDGAWSRAGRLPEPAAYGVSLVSDDCLWLVGGANASGTLCSVLKLRPPRREITSGIGSESERPASALEQPAGSESVFAPEQPAGSQPASILEQTVGAGPGCAFEQVAGPRLPFALEQAAGAAVGQTLYVVGGLAGGKPSAALLALDTRAADAGWRRLPDLPEPFVQPVMAASGGCLYLWGGFNPADGTVSDRGYRYDPAARTWRPIPGVPDGGTFTGGCAVTLSDGRILCAGGVDRRIFAAALQLPPEKLRDYLSQPPAAYRFRPTLWIFDPANERWTMLKYSRRTARAGAALVRHDGCVWLLGGEIKPGIRTPDVCRIAENPR